MQSANANNVVREVYREPNKSSDHRVRYIADIRCPYCGFTKTEAIIDDLELRVDIENRVANGVDEWGPKTCQSCRTVFVLSEDAKHAVLQTLKDSVPDHGRA